MLPDFLGYLALWGQSAQMQNNCLLQDCSDKHKWIVLDVPLFTCTGESAAQISHCVRKDPGYASFKLTKKIFTLSLEKTEFSSNACVCACNIWKSDKNNARCC